uniref:Uncharacterized protein n=1 Tax=Cannabis sativa TaxID=3483 RepID=A0A803QDE0_CANSA
MGVEVGGEGGKVRGGEFGVDDIPGMDGNPGINDGIPGMDGMPGMDGIPGMEGIPGILKKGGEFESPGIDENPGIDGNPGMLGMDGIPGMDGNFSSLMLSLAIFSLPCLFSNNFSPAPVHFALCTARALRAPHRLRPRAPVPCTRVPPRPRAPHCPRARRYLHLLALVLVSPALPCPTLLTPALPHAPAPRTMPAPRAQPPTLRQSSFPSWYQQSKQGSIRRDNDDTMSIDNVDKVHFI